LWDWDLVTDRVYYSPRWKALLGYAEGEIGDSTQDWFGRVHPDDLHILQRVIRYHHTSRNAHFEVELRMRHHDGEERWMLCRGTTVYDAQGDPQRMAGSISDITQRKHFEEQLRHSAFHDALTGLPNRSLLLDRLDQAIQRARDVAGHQFALLFLDLDRFKTINDSLGHLTGDLLLISVARRLQAAVRRSDTVARLGGDEFVILLDDIADRGEVASAVHQIEEALRLPFNLSGHEVFTSASIGVLMEAGQYEQPEALLRDADLAMYQAKALGRGRHEVFSESLHTEARQRLLLETDLHRALERQELRVFYQPIVSLESRRIIGAEALLRWEHPARGLVSPLDFIPLAEETGLIEPIGRWVVQHACAQAQEWHRQGHSHLTVSVNVSVRELKMPNFVEVVAATLQQTGLPPRFLILEMTESAYMEQASITGVVVERLRAMGVQIAFDDFGTGYSSLSYLRHFQVNRIKIDRSFIRDMTKNTTDLAITGAMIAMAHQLNINVVAEGVETEEHLELLSMYRCDTVQGYLISRPVPNDAFLELLERPAMGVAAGGAGAAPYGLIPPSALAETTVRGTGASAALLADGTTHDPLTGAYSRTLFEMLLREALERTQREGAACVLCLFDIDHFKSINDTYGHPRGDQILRELVQTIQQALRRGDLLFRYGGDEFVLLLTHTTLDQALLVCQRVFDTLRAASFGGTPPLKLTISMGVACFPGDADDGGQLLAVADRRNYLAKREGRNRFISADLPATPTLHVDTQERMIEREDALATLHSFLHRLTQAGCGVLTVSSPPGSGHSRFLSYVHQVAQMLNYAVLSLLPQPSFQRRPFAVLAAARWPVPLPFLDGSAALARALRQGLEQEGHSGLLITIDDQHWLDRATVEIFQQLLHSRALPRLALVVSSSQGKPDDRWSCAPLQQTVALPPFSETGLRVWLRSRLHWEPPASFLRWLYQQTKGLPAQVQRLLDHLVEQSLLSPDGDRWVLHPDYSAARLRSPCSTPAAPHNLPAHLTDFIGRANVCWAIDQLLETHRLVTLVGPGGSGKTRLALESAAAHLALYPDGVWFVALETLQAPELVASTVAKALGVSAPDDASLFERLKAFLRPRALLLVLDNFEQVLAAAPLITELLMAAPHLRMLVTSRERLHLVGERVFVVPPLDLPDLEEGGTLEALAQNEAVTLFAHRAAAVRYDFALTEANVRVVAELCIRLEGLPLAIELAAVRSDQFSPCELIEQLKHRLTALTDGPRNLSDRQRTLRDTIDWSYRLLPLAEQALFPCLGVFVDGFELPMAGRICPDAPDPIGAIQDRASGQTLEASLQSLVHKSLLHEREQAGIRRFAMLETVREYAVELLDRSPRGRAVRQRHAACYLELVEQAAPELTGPHQQEWLDHLERENGNLRAALGWLLEQEAVEQALTFVTAIWKLWQFRGRHSEGRRWIERVLAQTQTVVTGEHYRTGGPASQRPFDTARARALYALGWIAHDQGDYATVARAFEESLALSEALGDQRGMGLALQGIGSVTTVRGDHRQAQRCFERSRALFETLGDQEEVAWATEHLGQVARHLGDLEEAVRHHTESLTTFERLGHEWGVSIALVHLADDLLHLGELERTKALLEPWVMEQRNQHSAQRNMILSHGVQLLGRAEFYLGNLERAQAIVQECIRLSTTAGYQQHASAAYSDLGRLALAQGEYAEAKRAFQESLSLQQHLQELWPIQHTLTGTAVLAAALGQLDEATRLCAAADALCEANHTLRGPLYQPEYRRLQELIRTQLAPETAARLGAEGASMTLDRAVEYALAYLGSDK
jgi:diguanylate cyclase (GGDEF)-like protein/PAS domain S-box-containing protein